MSGGKVLPTVVISGSNGGAGALEAYDAIPWFEGAASDDGSVVTPSRSAALEERRYPHPAIKGGRLRDEGEIARGAMGSIRQLYDVDLRRRIALKVIEPSLATDPDMAQRFIDEARVTGALDHPNIVPVHDLAVGEGGQPSYTMKLVDGKTLTEMIAMQQSQRDLERILQCLVTVCEALSFAHSRGVVHRDLKPDNIMVGEFGQVYVMDWGCALVIGDRTLVDGVGEPEGTVIGTVRYMAPEQARGEVSQCDARTDVFSVGAMLYKALTGMAPYGGTMEEALAAAERANFRPPDQSNGVAVKPPPMLSAIVKKAMAYEPTERYQSASELGEALREFMRGGNWFPLHTFPAGTEIVREGDKADAAYIITKGRCEVRKRHPDNPFKFIQVRVLHAGEVFGETAIFANAPRSATVVALEDVSAVVVDRASLEHLVASSYLGKFVKALADRFLDVDGRLQELSGRRR